MRATAAAALIAVAAIAVLLIVRGDVERFTYDGPEAPAFSLSYEDLERVRPEPGELLRLADQPAPGGERGQSLVAEPLRFEPSAEPVGGSLPLAADRFIRRTERALDRFRLLEEGRTRLEVMEGIEAYQFGYTAKPRPLGPESPGEPGDILIGKTYLIPAQEEGAEGGVALTIVERTGEEKIRDAVREQPAGFFLTWPIRFWLQLATAVETPTALEQPVASFRFD